MRMTQIQRGTRSPTLSNFGLRAGTIGVTIHMGFVDLNSLEHGCYHFHQRTLWVNLDYINCRQSPRYCLPSNLFWFISSLPANHNPLNCMRPHLHNVVAAPQGLFSVAEHNVLVAQNADQLQVQEYNGQNCSGREEKSTLRSAGHFVTSLGKK